ncbi:DUF6538 domain-containing protein [Ferrimonas sp. SCSIO 43195]|uniref:DUF6538 domain-containing protein n=1 Tax=Ferrimonas sp. SCSIO 43195 TaxID=2822844 RepID=UPI003530621C
MRDFSGSKSSLNTPKTTPYLFQSRHGVWYARVVVPKGSYEGAKRSELRRSLGTKCHREAIQRSWRVLEELTS